MNSDENIPTISKQSPLNEEPDFNLLVVAGENIQRKDLPKRGVLSIGRTEDSDIQIRDTSISRRHANLIIGTQIFIEDCGSLNGILVAGQKVPSGKKVMLPPNEIAELGDVMLVIQRRPVSRKAEEAVRSREPAGIEQEVVIHDDHMASLHKLIERIAPSNINVIIHGETGVGKEVVARAIHRHSGRPEKLFVSINCAAMPENLLESELFGHMKGAFTGATKDKPGLLEIVKNGTFLLDEVTEMPMTLQAKLLRVLEERQVSRIGGLKPYSIEARFIATTNRDLEEAVQNGRFRQDLFYRLDGISLSVPPLRERLAEIEPLANSFIRASCEQSNRSPEPVLSDQALEWLTGHWWPGNVRELRNVVERAVVLCPGKRIEKEHVSADRMVSHLFMSKSETPSRPPVPDPSDADSTLPPDRISELKERASDKERRRVLEALQRAGGNQTKAAKLLGVSRRTLINRLDAFGIERPRKKKKT